jgi:ADP-ribose pyrophosphatase YjhB (NUDIX family)
LPHPRGARLLVVAAALVDADGRVLLQQRPEGKSMAGLWEFPGGKIEPGETPEAALVRELEEELGIRTYESCLAPATFAAESLGRERSRSAALCLSQMERRAGIAPRQRAPVGEAGSDVRAADAARRSAHDRGAGGVDLKIPVSFSV